MASRSSVRWRLGLCIVAALALFLSPCVSAQPKTPAQAKLSPADQRKLEQKLLKDLKQPYKRWLTEEVAYIILPEERLQLLQSKTEAERKEFIQQFWLRRDPTSGTQANEFRDEHYRRVKYANERFAEGTAGWRTDRGVFYILYGPPDEIKHNEGPWAVPIDDDMKFARLLSGYTGKSPGDVVPVYPFQKWRYRYIAGIGSNVQLEFVDRTSSGRYELAEDPGEKYEYAPVPGGLFDVLTHGLMPGAPLSGGGNYLSNLAFDLRVRQMEQLLNQGKLMKVSAEPTAKDKKPEEVVYWRVVRNVLPMQFRVDVFRGQNGGSVASLILSFRKTDIKFTPKGDLNHALVNLRGFLTDAVGHTVAKFENGIEWNVPKTWLENPAPAIYQKPLLLPPGRYLLQVELQDAATGDAAKLEQPIDVPDFDSGGLACSSLELSAWPKARAASGRALPQVSFDGSFRRDQRMGIYLQVYNLSVDAASQKPRASVEYLILQGDAVVFRQQETLADGDPAKLTLTKTISLAAVQPGEYLLKVRLTDKVRQQSVEPQAKFRVIP
jgi:GWxTD domain-containing protein